MNPASLLIASILTLGSVVHGQTVVDGTDASSKHHNKNVRVSVNTDAFGISTLIVEAAKKSVPKRSILSVVLRSDSAEKDSYTYIPLLIEDGDDIDSWSTRTGQNVTRTWMRGRHGIFFSTCRMPESKLKELVLEVLIGDHMKDPTFQYSLKKIAREAGTDKPATRPESK